MDDPWGSPWSSANNDDKANRDAAHGSSASHRDELAPPPPAFFSVSTPTASTNAGFPSLPPFSGHSPWADEEEDGFGDWASAEPAAPAWGPATSNGVAGLGSHLNALQVDHEGGFGRASPIAWPEAAATGSPALKALSRPRSNTTLRQPSPDPWAADGARTPSLHAPSPSWSRRPSRSSSKGGIPSPLATPALVPLAAEARISSESDRVGRNKEEDEPKDASDHGSSAPSAPLRAQGEQKQSPKSKAGTNSSRPQSRSSTPESEDSRPRIDRPDSPITSIDEDASHRPGTGQRKVSANVQVLVDMYDGLVKTASTESETHKSDRSRSREKIASASDGDDAEFGDFEEAVEVQPKLQESQQFEGPEKLKDELPESRSRRTSRSFSLERPAAPATPSHDLPTKKAEESRPDQGSPHSHEIPPPSLFRQIASKYGKITFDVDLGKVDEIFKAAPTHNLPARVKETSADIPDHVITDGFSSIGERKTWYRISRLGSSRKHNSGDDENYRRVTWPTSAVQVDSLKIVRRWMEEDSITGRATLGGVAAKGNLFGWDTAASEPVSLGHIFAKRRHEKVSGKSGHRPQLSEPLRASSLDSVRKMALHARQRSGHFDSPRSPLVPSVNLGSSSVPASARPEHLTTPTRGNSLPGPKPTESSPASRPLVPPTNWLGTRRTAGKPELVLGLSKATVRAETEEEDDDEEWGEMVASPAQGAFPPPQTNSLPLRGGDESKEPAATTITTILNQHNKPPIIVPKPSSLDIHPSAANVPPPSSSAIIKHDTPITVASDHVSSPPALPPAQDPWGKVDFSFFDGPATEGARAPSSLPVDGESTEAAVKPTPVTGRDLLPVGTTAVRSADTGREVIGTPPSGKKLSMSDDDDDAIARKILSGLPDLSYMLR